MGTTLRSGQLSQATGVSTDTLRHYERLGLLPRPPRNAANYRNYPESALVRVETIQAALRIGFSLLELKDILAARDRGAPPCRRVRELLDSKIGGLREEIDHLNCLHLELVRLSNLWDHQLQRSPPSRPVRLLERLASQEFRRAPRRRSILPRRKGRSADAT
jgi:DNA-binding transcriptional MerR regulator